MEVREKELINRLYEKVFSTPEGLLVLADLVNDMGGLSKELTGEKDLILQNQVRHILSKCGAWVPEKTYQIVAGLMRIDWANLPAVEGENNESE